MNNAQYGREFIFKHVSASRPESEIQNVYIHSAAQVDIEDRGDGMLEVHSAWALSIISE